ncbi:MAG: LapA family protein [Verrucomicrobia bacterium]|nr:LapA family protein [Verrucomicrobiota bacterium]
MKRHFRIILTIVIVVLLGALIIQNHAPVRAQLLFVAVEMPLILLLALTSGLGFVLGLLVAYTGVIKPKS